MKRVAALVLIFSYALLGTGLLERLHNAEHAAEDAHLLALATHAGMPLDHPPLHDDSNCAVHSQLHLASMSVSWAPLLICLGLFVAFLTQLPLVLPFRRIVFALTCRGPPAF